MARKERYLVGLDVGTSKVTAVVGEVIDSKALDIVGLGVAESRGIRRGVASNQLQRCGTVHRPRPRPNVREQEFHGVTIGEAVRGADKDDATGDRLSAVRMEILRVCAVRHH